MTEEQIRAEARADTDRQMSDATFIVENINVYGRERGTPRYGNENRLIAAIARALANEMRYGAIKQREILEAKQVVTGSKP